MIHMTRSGRIVSMDEHPTEKGMMRVRVQYGEPPKKADKNAPTQPPEMTEILLPAMAGYHVGQKVKMMMSLEAEKPGSKLTARMKKYPKES